LAASPWHLQDFLVFAEHLLQLVESRAIHISRDLESPRKQDANVRLPAFLSWRAILLSQRRRRRRRRRLNDCHFSHRNPRGTAVDTDVIAIIRNPINAPRRLELVMINSNSRRRDFAAVQHPHEDTDDLLDIARHRFAPLGASS
jgi:hypothetical protein